MKTEYVTNMATPKDKHGIVSLVKEALTQVYFKTAQRLLRFHLRREREFQTDDPENAKLVLHRSIRVRGKT